jgi:hypothetical protein
VFGYSMRTPTLMEGVVEMVVLCAWCCREGEPGYLGEREPLDNPGPTHGICSRHKTEFLESLPSRSFPDAELLIIARRENPVLYAHLKRIFGAVSGVTVVLERREAERRAVPRPDSYERRISERRIFEGTASGLGDFTMVRFMPKCLGGGPERTPQGHRAEL